MREKIRIQKILGCLMTALCLLLLPWTATAAKEAKLKPIMAGELAVYAPASGAAAPQAEVQARSSRAGMPGWSYGRQLTGEAKRVYHALASISDMQAYSAEHPFRFLMNTPQYYPNKVQYSQRSRELLSECVRAAHAYLEDSGETYWVSYLGVRPVAYEEYGTGRVYLHGLDFYPVDYYEGIRGELGMTQQELDRAIAAVRAESGTFNRVKMAHDYIIQMMEYDLAEDAGVWKGQNHTITGGLLDQYGHLGVCESYAKLFRILCEAVEIPCILISGGSDWNWDGTVIADHMWNYVQMDDGLWYLVDLTWDDAGGTQIRYQFFLTGSQTVVGGQRMDDNHVPVGYFGTEEAIAYEPFEVPMLAPNSYFTKNPELQPVTGITLSASQMMLYTGSSKTLAVTEVTPGNANYGNRYRFESSDASIAAVNQQGVITAKGEGNATITVFGKENQHIEASCTVTVKKPFVKLNAASFPLQWKRSTTALRIAELCSDGDRAVRWSSSNKKVATVNQKGKITAKKTGKTKITVVMASGARATCTVTVQKGSVKLRAIKLPAKTAVLSVGQTFPLNAAKSPVTAAGKLTYRSSAKSVAAVNGKGVVTAKKRGSAAITVRCGKRSAKVRVTVE